MPSGSLNFADVAAASGSPQIQGLIEHNLVATPELALFPTRKMVGTSYQTLIRTALPSVGFVAPGEGVGATKSSVSRKTAQMYMTKARVQCPVEMADEWDRESKIPGGYFNFEANGVLAASLITLGTQMFYGTAAGSDKGFQGLLSLTGAIGSTAVLDATGSTAGAGSSVYMVYASEPDEHGACLMLGNNTTFELPPPRIETITVTNEDGASKQCDGYVSQMLGYSGLRVGHVHCAKRIYNLTAQAGKTLTDALLDQLWAKFPSLLKPNMIFMSRRSRNQLATSRGVTSTTVINSSGEQLSVRGTQQLYYNGIPIIDTDSIVDTETIL